MKCEYCDKALILGEIAHGFKYGTADDYNEVFLPARESAWSVICSSCGEKVYRLIYSNLCNTSINPTSSKTYLQSR